MYRYNIITSICDTLDNDPDSSNIPLLQSNITPLKTRIVDLTDKIGAGYLAFDSHTHQLLRSK